MHRITFWKKNWLILFPVLSALGILLIDINKPFIGHHDFTNVFDGMVARNFLEYGLIPLKFGQLQSHLNGPISEVSSYYTHYPPLLTVLIFISFRIFGVVEWAERLVPLTFSVIGAGAFFLICRRFWGDTTTILASIFYIFNPMFIYFGNMAVPDPLIIANVVLEFYIFLRWQDKYQLKFLVILGVLTLIHGLIGWPIAYSSFILIGYAILNHTFRRSLLVLPVITGFTLILMLVHTYILTGSFFGGGLLSTLQFRLFDPINFGGLNYTPINFIRQELSWLQVYFTRIVLILSTIYILGNLNFRFDKKKLTVLVFLLYGLIHVVVFSRYVFVHDFLNIYLLPFLALSGALGCQIVLGWIRKWHASKLIIWGFLAIVVILFLTERISYTTALIKSSENLAGKQMGELINTLQVKPNQVAVVSPRFQTFYGVFAQFYTKYGYQIYDEASLVKESNLTAHPYIIMIDEDIVDRDFYNSLISKYRSVRRKDLTIIYTNESKSTTD